MKYNYKWIEAFDLANNGNRLLLDEHIGNVYQEMIIPTLRAKCNRIDVVDLANEVVIVFIVLFYFVLIITRSLNEV